MLGQARISSDLTAVMVRLGKVSMVAALAGALGACSLLPHRLRPGSETGAEVKSPPGSDQPYPHLGEVPDKPSFTETADTRREIAKGLISDREAARYTDEALRGGTEASAAPPPPHVAGALPALPDEATSDPKMADNKAQPEKKPGFFARLFGKNEKAPDPDQPAPLPAHPVGDVDVQQAPATAPSN